MTDLTPEKLDEALLEELIETGSRSQLTSMIMVFANEIRRLRAMREWRPIETGPVVKRMARAIADMIMDGYDNAQVTKSEWIETHGEKGGRYRDINEPFQSDYDEAAQAALSVILAEIEAERAEDEARRERAHFLDGNRILDRLTARLKGETDD